MNQLGIFLKFIENILQKKFATLLRFTFNDCYSISGPSRDWFLMYSRALTRRTAVVQKICSLNPRADCITGDKDSCTKPCLKPVGGKCHLARFRQLQIYFPRLRPKVPIEKSNVGIDMSWKLNVPCNVFNKCALSRRTWLLASMRSFFSLSSAAWASASRTMFSISSLDRPPLKRRENMEIALELQ